MNTINLYRVWCPHEDEWAEVWAQEPPTISPLNAGSPIDPEKTYIIDTISQQFPTSDIGTKIILQAIQKTTTLIHRYQLQQQRQIQQ